MGTVREESERVRRLADVFGDVLPSGTQDDLPEPPDGDGDVDVDVARAERWLRENRPPHHDPA